MKYIIKGQESEVFREWKAQNNENWQPTFNELRGKEKESVFHALFTEQGYICCYCQCRLTPNKCHIDHLQPQKGSQEIDPLDYSNFVCSCQRNLQRGDPIHCGNAKKNKYLPISPLDPTCESRFKFKVAYHIWFRQSVRSVTSTELSQNLFSFLDEVLQTGVLLEKDHYAYLSIVAQLVKYFGRKKIF